MTIAASSSGTGSQWERRSNADLCPQVVSKRLVVEGSWEDATGRRTRSLWPVGQGRRRKARAGSVCRTVVEVKVSAELVMSQRQGMKLGEKMGGRPGSGLWREIAGGIPRQNSMTKDDQELPHAPGSFHHSPRSFFPSWALGASSDGFHRPGRRVRGIWFLCVHYLATLPRTWKRPSSKFRSEQRVLQHTQSLT